VFLFCAIYCNLYIFLLLQVIKTCGNGEFKCLITTRNFLQTSQNLVLNFVLSEDLQWSEYQLYLACYFWSKYQASQQLENTLEEFTDASNFFELRRYAWGHSRQGGESSIDEEMQETVDVDLTVVKTYMEPFLPHIRLLTFSATMLKEILNKYCCFTPIEKSLIYSSFIGNNEFAYLPEEFCKSKTPRTHKIEPIYTFGFLENEVKNWSFYELYYRFSIGKEFITMLDTRESLLEVRIKVPTQEKCSADESLYYEESISVILTNSLNDSYVTGPLTKRAARGSQMQVKIYPPIKFHGMFRELTVTIIRHKSGLYPKYKPKIQIISTVIRRTWDSEYFSEPYPKCKRIRYAPNLSPNHSVQTAEDP
jgi:hypothetical protein